MVHVSLLFIWSTFLCCLYGPRISVVYMVHVSLSFIWSTYLCCLYGPRFSVVYMVHVSLSFIWSTYLCRLYGPRISVVYMVHVSLLFIWSTYLCCLYGPRISFVYMVHVSLLFILAVTKVHLTWYVLYWLRKLLIILYFYEYMYMRCFSSNEKETWFYMNSLVWMFWMGSICIILQAKLYNVWEGEALKYMVLDSVC